jgi:hypothetical protein
MPRIRDKSLQSRRMGSTLNGLSANDGVNSILGAVGEFDQTDWSGDYEPLTSGEWTGGAIYSDFVPDAPSSPNLYANQPVSQSPNIFGDLLAFGTKLLAPQPTQQPQQRITTQAPVKRTINNMPLLIAAGLAAVFILSQKRR